MHKWLALAMFLCAAVLVAGVSRAAVLLTEPVTVRLKNEHVRVLEVRLKPGEKVAQHSHPSRVVFSLSPYTMKFTYPDGGTSTRERKGGEVTWREPETHAAENVGSTEFHVMVVEIIPTKENADAGR